MKAVLLRSGVAVMTINVMMRYVSAAESPVIHDPAVHIGGGLKRELLAGITEADFCKLGDKPQTVRITLVNAFTEANSWLNLNGYSHGKAVYTIPLGWTVEVTFINPSPSPHSVVLVERAMVGKLRVGEPAFKNASTPDPVTGMSSSKASFTFHTTTPGSYALACGIPTHASAGHWLALEVPAEAKVPSLQLGDRPAVDVK